MPVGVLESMRPVEVELVLVVVKRAVEQAVEVLLLELVQEGS